MDNLFDHNVLWINIHRIGMDAFLVCTKNQKVKTAKSY